MKKALTMLLAGIVTASAMVFPTSAAAEPTILWDFNSDEALNDVMSGANAVSYFGDTIDDVECYEFIASGNDPYVSINISADSADDVVWAKARVKNPSYATAIELFGATNGRSLTGSECTHIDLKSEDEGWYTYLIYIPDENVRTVNAYKDAQYAITEPYWAGTVEYIRLDPLWREGDDGSDAGGNMTGGESLYIDYIAFFPTKKDALAYRSELDNYAFPEQAGETAAAATTTAAPAASGVAGDIVTDGLVAYYDGANNANGSQDKDTTVWKDLSGKGYDFEIELDDNNYWTDNSLHVDSTWCYFPDELVDVVNGDQYTVEFAAGELEYPGTNWISLIISDNDEFSLFVRVENDNLEFKYNDANSDRPVAEGGADLVSDSTVAVTFNIDEAECNMYVDGVLVYEAIPLETNIADTLFLGHSAPERNWSGDVYSIRFYDRALTAEEVAQNAAADNAKYRTEAAPVAEVPSTEEVVEEPAAEVVETVEAPAAEDTSAEEAAEPVEEAPQTFDMGIIAAAAAILSAAGYAIAKKR